MGDKARNSHIERTVYVSPLTRPGDSVRYGDWRDDDREHTWYADRYENPGNPLGRFVAHGLPLTIIECATGSDYSGNLVQISNARCLKRDFPWLVELHGGHGTSGVAYLGKRENQNDRLIEAIDALASYPLYDDSDHSDLEHEREAAAWEDDGRKDFKRELVKHFDLILDEEHEHDEDLMLDEHVDALWYDCCEIYRGGESYLNEQGDSIYFPIYRLFKQISDSRFASYLDKGPYNGERGTIREQFAALCDACRIANDQPEQGA